MEYDCTNCFNSSCSIRCIPNEFMDFYCHYRSNDLDDFSHSGFHNLANDCYYNRYGSPNIRCVLINYMANHCYSSSNFLDVACYSCSNNLDYVSYCDYNSGSKYSKFRSSWLEFTFISNKRNHVCNFCIHKRYLVSYC